MMVEGEFKNFKWDRAKKMMKNINAFLDKLKTYDAENMPDKLIDKLTPMMDHEMMNYDVMIKKSSAAANLCNWVINIQVQPNLY
jgi:dynein heavy chain